MASYLSSSGLLVPLPVLAVLRILDAAPWLIAALLGLDCLLHDRLARLRESAPPRSPTHSQIHPSLCAQPPAHYPL